MATNHSTCTVLIWDCHFLFLSCCAVCGAHGKNRGHVLAFILFWYFLLLTCLVHSRCSCLLNKPFLTVMCSHVCFLLKHSVICHNYHLGLMMVKDFGSMRLTNFSCHFKKFYSLKQHIFSAQKLSEVYATASSQSLPLCEVSFWTFCGLSLGSCKCVTARHEWEKIKCYSYIIIAPVSEAFIVALQSFKFMKVHSLHFVLEFIFVSLYIFYLQRLSTMIVAYFITKCNE